MNLHTALPSVQRPSQKIEKPNVVTTGEGDTQRSEKESVASSTQSQRKSIKLATVAHTFKWLVTKKETNIFWEKLRSKKNLTWHDIVGNEMLSEHNVQFILNFNENLLNHMAGAKLFEDLGYEIPDVIKFCTMDRDRLRVERHYVSKMIKTYNSVIKDLTIPQMNFLRDHIKDVEMHIQPGISRILWTSMGILEYCDECNLKIKNLQSLIQQLNHMEIDLVKRIKGLAEFNLFPFISVKEEPSRLPCKQFFNEMSDMRTEQVCFKKYFFFIKYKSLGESNGESI